MIYLLITVLILLGIPTLQYFVIDKKKKQYIFVSYLFAALLLIFFQVQSSITTNQIKSDLSAVIDYSSVAKLDALGNPPGSGFGSDIVYNSELTSLLKGTYSVRDNQIFMKRNVKSESRYKEIINKYPNFPFGHYYLALCLRDKGDVSWKDAAKKAITILEQTTKIDGHNSNHDEVLSKLRIYLKQ